MKKLEIITETKKTADLAKLSFEKEKLCAFEADMESILSFVAKASEAKKAPTANKKCEKALLREDIQKSNFTKEELLKNAPETFDGYIATPRVIE